MNFDTFEQIKILLKEKKSGAFGVRSNLASGVNHNSFGNCCSVIITNNHDFGAFNLLQILNSRTI